MPKLRALILVVLTLVATAAVADGPGRAAVASAHPAATQVGHDILDAGGNAFDAAVAVSAALGVVEPTGSGLGGGGFWMLHFVEDGRAVMVDGREVAPGAASRDMYLDADGNPVPRLSKDGVLAAGIPGNPAALAHISEKYGRLSLEEALAPAARLARSGFEVDPRLQAGIRFKKDLLSRFPHSARIFLADGEVPEVGHVIRQPELAVTLERLARQGADGFYRGATAESLVAGVRAAGGLWTLEDFAAYRVKERAPVVINYRGVRIVTAPPPSAGGVALANVFNILNGFELDELDRTTRIHVVVESMRRAYRDRAEFLGDPDFVPMPLERLTHPYYAAGQRASIRLDRATPSDALPGILDAGGKGMQTTHFSVLDAEGNRVAASMSLNFWFGSGFTDPGTGVVLNNEMDDFSVKPGVANGYQLVGAAANAIEPGKRMLSSMTPTFLESDRGIAILGTPGGSRIISMVLLSTLAWIDGADAATMAALPRFHHQYLPDQIFHEPDALDAELKAALSGLGHTLVESRRRYGNMQVVTWDFATGEVSAASDPRAGGESLVY